MLKLARAAEGSRKVVATATIAKCGIAVGTRPEEDDQDEEARDAMTSLAPLLGRGLSASP
jgi:hypothetical protein